MRDREKRRLGEEERRTEESMKAVLTMAGKSLGARTSESAAGRQRN
jgi:hypothetical protein